MSPITPAVFESRQPRRRQRVSPFAPGEPLSPIAASEDNPSPSAVDDEATAALRAAAFASARGGDDGDDGDNGEGEDADGEQEEDVEEEDENAGHTMDDGHTTGTLRTMPALATPSVAARSRSASASTPLTPGTSSLRTVSPLKSSHSAQQQATRAQQAAWSPIVDDAARERSWSHDDDSGARRQQRQQQQHQHYFPEGDADEFWQPPPPPPPRVHAPPYLDAWRLLHAAAERGAPVLPTTTPFSPSYQPFAATTWAPMPVSPSLTNLTSLYRRRVQQRTQGYPLVF